MKPDDILIALQDLTERERIEFLPLAPEMRKPSSYAPIEKYLLDLKNSAKPESAAEDLFTALCNDVLGFQPTRQVGVAEGFADALLNQGFSGFSAASRSSYSGRRSQRLIGTRGGWELPTILTLYLCL